VTGIAGLDVAVIGAGPAGAWTAYRLARVGATVALFDASHPREKPCGGGVTGRALDLVSEALSAGLTHHGGVAIRGARFGDAVVPLDNRALIVVSRQAFDAALLQAAVRAGATLVRERVADVTLRDDGVIVQTTSGVHRTAFLVGADGANSLVRRRVTSAFRRDQLSIATGVYAHGVTSDEIVIEFVDDPPGYIWSFPRADHLAIGICAQADAGVTSGALRERVARWIHESAGARLPAEAAESRRWEPYSWPIPSLSEHDLSAPVAGARWLLVGDAAGFVDPITREGIFFALQSADHAAAALTTRDPVRAYEARVRAEIVPELALAARLKAGFFTPPFVRLLLAALDASPRIRAVMADLVAGRQSYRTLKWRLLRTFELRLAWQAVKAKEW
jgi:geranylgeranyl reductase family protein